MFFTTKKWWLRLAATIVFAAPVVAQADVWEDRWSHVEHLDHCHTVSEDELQFLDCAIVKGEEVLDRFQSAVRGNIRSAERGLINVDQFRQLLRLSADQLPKQSINNNAFRRTGKGMMWNYLSLPIQIEHQDWLNEKRLALARQERDQALTSQQRQFAHQLVEESLAKRDRLRDAVELFQEFRERVTASFWDEVHPDHREDVVLSFQAQS